MKKIKIIIVLLLLAIVSTSTYCIFTKHVEKTGNIETNELSAVFLDNNDFLIKLQVLYPTITSVDKLNDLNRVNSVPNITFTNDNVFSTSESSMPIYVWVDNNVINYYTGATSIDFNNN